MHNASIPSHVELPSSRQLVRSTLIAVAAAGAILVAVVLPAEYGVDPTGAGDILGLTEMGQIKTQLAAEADADQAADVAAAPTSAPAVAPLPTSTPTATVASRSDAMTVTLTPGEGAEVKLSMNQGAKANYGWTVSGGTVNFDLHADGGGRSTRYEQGRSVPAAQGVLEAAFDGNHGWFWRNRGDSPVTVTLRTNGAYSEIKRVT